jgi:hypothetical protein
MTLTVVVRTFSIGMGNPIGIMTAKKVSRLVTGNL